MSVKRAAIVERYCLNPDSLRNTYHLVLEGDPICFSPGDSVGIYPKNPLEQVRLLLTYFGLSAHSAVVDPKTKAIVPAEVWFSSYVEINTISPHMLRYIAACAFSEEDRDRVREYQGDIHQYDLYQFLSLYVPGGVNFRDVVYGFTPLRPRLYSLSSAPQRQSGRFELTVAQVVSEHGKKGVCSNYLVDMPLGCKEVGLFVQPSRHFSFPSKGPYIMIGAGTGIAPFRSFVEHLQNEQAAEDCWLFFGEKYRSRDFFYQNFWEELESSGHIKLSLAFSRDQDEKIYVQHRMWQEREQLWHFLEQRKATILVCGSAARLAKSVENTLVDIACDQGGLDKEEALSYLQNMRREKRYVKDVY